MGYVNPLKPKKHLRRIVLSAYIFNSNSKTYAVETLGGSIGEKEEIFIR